MRTFEDVGIDTMGKTGKIKTVCPQCSHTRTNWRDPCLSLDIDRGLWKCHHCAFQGSLLEPRGLERERKSYTKPVFHPEPLVHPLLADYFQRRGIDASQITAAQIALRLKYFGDAGQEIAAIQFPYFRGGECVNIKWRALDRKAFCQEKGAEKIFYGLDSLAGHEWAVIVEGELDQLSCAQAGVPNCLSVPDGAPPAGSHPSDTKFEYLPNCEQELAHLTKIVLAVDTDGPGQVLEAELARRLGPERCYRVQWPVGCKDANDLLMRDGPQALAGCLRAATPWPIAGVVEVRDLIDDVEALYEKGEDRGISPGWAAVNQYYSVRPGELTIVTGIPGHGKSEWLDALLINLTEAAAWRFAVCSPENFPLAGHVAKLLEKYTRKSFGGADHASRMTRGEMSDGFQWLQDHLVFLNPASDSLRVDAVLDLARQCVLRYGIRGLLIDPWNEFDHAMGPGQTETTYIGAMLTTIRRFARNHGVHVWVVAHPMKLRKREDETYPVPTPYDITGSAHWRNKADNCLAIYREVGAEDDLAVQIHIQKVRFRQTGKVGMAVLHWNPVNGCYS